MNVEKDHYATLGLRADASALQIKQAFRKKALVSHPDRGGSHYRMQELNEAWDVLGSPEVRREYDSLRTARERGASPTRGGVQTGAVRRQASGMQQSPARESRLIKSLGRVAMRVAFGIGRFIRHLVGAK